MIMLPRRLSVANFRVDWFLATILLQDCVPNFVVLQQFIMGAAISVDAGHNTNIVPSGILRWFGVILLTDDVISCFPKATWMTDHLLIGFTSVSQTDQDSIVQFCNNSEDIVLLMDGVVFCIQSTGDLRIFFHLQSRVLVLFGQFWCLGTQSATIILSLLLLYTWVMSVTVHWTVLMATVLLGNELPYDLLRLHDWLQSKALTAPRSGYSIRGRARIDSYHFTDTVFFTAILVVIHASAWGYELRLSSAFTVILLLLLWIISYLSSSKAALWTCFCVVTYPELVRAILILRCHTVLFYRYNGWSVSCGNISLADWLECFHFQARMYFIDARTTPWFFWDSV